MPDQVTVTTRQGWFSRIGGAFAGVLVGLVLIVACVWGLAWNEGNAVKVARGLTEGAGVVVEAPASAIDPANDQKLVHVVGDIAVTAPLEDSAFGVAATGVKLSRKVEMYQWREDSESETRTRLGGGEETVTTYSYTKDWAVGAIDSSAFNTPAGHENPRPAFESAVVFATDATLGGYRLEEPVLGQVGGAQPLNLSGQTDSIAKAIGRTPAHAVSGATLFLGRNAQAPAVGDLRISYEVTPAEEISVIARQNGDKLLDYRARNGSTFLLVADGAVPAADMFKSAQDANDMLAWIIRAIGVALLMVGFGMILAPFGVLADVLPLAGTIVRMGTGLIGFVLGLVVGTVTIALAWLAFRPITTIVILAVGGAIAFAVYRFGRGRSKRKLAAEAAVA